MVQPKNETKRAGGVQTAHLESDTMRRFQLNGPPGMPLGNNNMHLGHDHDKDHSFTAVHKDSQPPSKTEFLLI